jgi:hypothetical protein
MRHKLPSERVEILLDVLFEGSGYSGPWVDDWTVEAEMEDLGYHQALEMPVPYQYALLTLATDRTRAVVRETLLAVQAAAAQLLAVLEVYAQAQTADQPEWAKFVALLEAPFPVTLPESCDTRDLDVVALILRDVYFGGSWGRMLDWVAQHGSEAQQRKDIPHFRRLAAFELAYGVNLAELLFSEEARAENARLAKTEHPEWPRPSEV